MVKTWSRGSRFRKGAEMLTMNVQRDIWGGGGARTENTKLWPVILVTSPWGKSAS